MGRTEELDGVTAGIEKLERMFGRVREALAQEIRSSGGRGRIRGGGGGSGTVWRRRWVWRVSGATLSVVMIVKDEEACLGRVSRASVGWRTRS